MIHHISIPAEDPCHVANVLAELWDGLVVPFLPTSGGYAGGSYVAFAGNEHGTAIEVYPLGTELIPGEGDQEADSRENGCPSRFTATHAAISVPTDQDHIEKVATREGWRTLRCARGLRSSNDYFEVIEFWVENRFMLELLTPEMSLQYMAFLNPSKLKGFTSKPASVR